MAKTAVLSDRTLHLKLYVKQWDDLERDEARALKRNEKRNEPKRLDGYKVARARQLIDMGREYERLMKRERRTERRVTRTVSCVHPNGGEHEGGRTYRCIDCGVRFDGEYPEVVPS